MSVKPKGVGRTAFQEDEKRPYQHRESNRILVPNLIRFSCAGPEMIFDIAVGTLALSLQLLRRD
jgi:hypothetical protein